MGIQKASLSLNPVNNPYFEVQRFEGFKAGGASLNDNPFTNKNSVSLNIFRGRDGKAVKLDTIGVSLVEADEKGNKKENGKTIVLLHPYADKDGNVYKDENGNEVISKEEHESFITTVGTSYSVALEISRDENPELAFNSYYLIEVTAFDTGKIGIFNEKSYGFKFVTSAVPPTVEFSSPLYNGKLGNLKKSEKAVISGIVKTEESEIDAAVYFEENTEENLIAKKPLEYSEELKGWPFEFEIDTTGDKYLCVGSEMPKIIVEAKSPTQIKTETVSVDSAAPEINDNPTVSPTVEKEIDGKVKVCVNGKITIKQNVSDNQQIAKTEYSLDGGKNWTDAGSKPLMQFPEIDTTEFEDGSEKIILLKVTDTAGNVTKGEIPLYVEQSTDKPVLELTNADTGITDAKDISVEKDSVKNNLFGTVSNNTLQGTVSDDDGIDAIEIVVTDSNGEEKGKKTVSCKGTSTYTLSYKLPSEEGTYTVSIKAKDTKNETEFCSDSAEFAVAVDKGVPELIVSTVSGAYHSANSQFDISGTLDEKAVVGLYSDSECKTPVEETEQKSFDEGKWSLALPAAGKGAKIYIQAKDVYGQTSTKEFEYKIDSFRPEFKITSVAGEDYDESVSVRYAGRKSLFTVRGEVWDVAEVDGETVDSSGLQDNFYYKTGVDSEFEKAVISRKETGNSEWIANISFSDEKFKEGDSLDIYFEARDEAGNVSAEKEPLKLVIDSVAPVFGEVETLTENSKLYAQVKITDNLNGTETVNGSGIKKVVLVLNRAEVLEVSEPSSTEETDGVEYSVFKLEIPTENFVNGDNKWTVKAFDKAGNESTSEEQTIANEAPSAELTNKLENNHKRGEYYYTNSAFDIPYVLKCAKGFSAAYWQENDDEEHQFTFDENDTEIKGTVTIAVPAASKKVVNTFVAKNEIGASAEASLKYIFDVDKPTVAVNLKSAGAASTVEDGDTIDARKTWIIQGTASDDFGGDETLNSGLSEVLFTVEKGKLDSAPESANWENAQGSSEWKVKLDLTADTYGEGGWTVFIKAVDNVGNESDAARLAVTVDKEEPAIKLVSVNENPASELSQYYNAATVLKGTLKESFLKNASVKVTRDGNDTDTGFDGEIVPADSVGKEYDWSVSLPATSGVYKIALSAEDKAGNKISQTYETTIDVDKPVLVTSGDNAWTLNGKTHSDTLWLNSTDITVKMEWKEELSGIKTVQYQTISSGGGYSDAAELGASKKINAQISGFAESSGGNHNGLRFWAVDNAGNKSAETEVVVKIDLNQPEISGLEYAFAKDAAGTEYDTPKSISSVVLTNKAKPIKIIGKCSDAASGVESVTLAFESKEITAKIDDGGSWSAVIETSDMEPLSDSGAHKVSLVVKDNAGNINSQNSFQLKVDSVAPKTEILSPAKGAVLNGTISLSGTVSEENNPRSIELYYYFSTEENASAPTSLSDWKSIKKISTEESGVSISDIYNWKIPFDVNDVLGSSEKGTLFLLPVAYDEAGNNSICGSADIESAAIAVRADSAEGGGEGYSSFKVDLNSDRPEIKFSNLGWDKENNKTAEFIKYASSLTGTVTDDDGIRVLKIADSENEPSDSDWTSVEDVPVSSGSFQFDLGGDGAKNLWFYIEDTAGGKFVTKDVTPYKRPFVTYVDSGKNEHQESNDEPVSFVTDSNPPEIKDFEFSYGRDKDAAEKADKVGLSPDGSDVVGGTAKKFVSLSVTAEDNGSRVEKITATIKTSEKTIIENLPLNLSDGNTFSCEAFDVSDWAGKYTINFSVLDKAGLETKDSRQITVDNTAPVVELISPGSDTVTGVVTLKGTSSDSYSEVKTLNFYVPNDETWDNSALTEAGKDDAKKENSVLADGASVTSWTFVLDGEKKLPLTDEELLNYTKFPKSDENYTLPVVFYVADELGNEDWVVKNISYNPFDDRPVAVITYPTGGTPGEDVTSDLSTVSGQIRVTGSATDNESVAKGKVYIQIDVNNDGKFEDSDKDALKELYPGKFVEDITAVTGVTDSSALNTTYYPDATTWGILVSGTNNWSITLNAADELKLGSAAVGSDGKYKLGVRAVALDSSGVFGQWSSPSYFVIDQNVPSFTKMEIVPSVDAETSRAYEEDMYLNGTQSLKLTVTDKTGIKKISYQYGSDLNSLLSSKTLELTDGEISSFDGTVVKTAETTPTYSVYIPVSKLAGETNGDLALKVTAYKDSDTDSTNYERFVMHFDDTAPSVSKITLNGDVAADDKLANKIVNSNGTYFTLGGAVSDMGAGFERAAFYLYRDKQNNEGQKRRVYDPVLKEFNSASDIVVQVTEDLGTGTKAGIAVKEIDDGTNSANLYGYKWDCSVSDEGKTITLSEENEHIRPAGLVLINGVWHKIEKIEGTKITLATATTASLSVSAFFPIAQVIDNTAKEATDAEGGLSSSAIDDGDKMAESVVKSGTTWNFDATIHSHYIPDGPVTLVLFVWDKAGNVSVKTYGASVQNNAPRLTKLWLGTSLNGGFDGAAFKEYDVLSRTGIAQNSYELSTKDYGSRFRVKGDLGVVAEFTGGNNASKSTDGSRIKMVFNNDASKETNGYVSANDEHPVSAMEKAGANGGVYYDAELAKSNAFEKSTGTSFADLENFAYVIPKGKLGEDSKDNSARFMSFTFWDDTEETTQGTDSSYSYLKINDLIVMITDSTPPTVTIDPFFWKSQDDNSLAENSYLNGHIDLPATEGATFDLATGMFKKGENIVVGTPQVSGKVVFRGSVLDGHGINSISVKPIGAAEYTEVAKLENGVMKAAENSGFTILEDKSVEQGHLIAWEYECDTSKFIGSQTFSVRATDTASSPHESLDKISENGKEVAKIEDIPLGSDGKYDICDDELLLNVPRYDVSLVPYISGVEGASRSRLGKYSVRAGETVTLIGFNFSGTPTVKRRMSDGTVKSDITGATLEGSTKIKFNAPEYSGFIDVSFGGTSVQNNSNENVTYNIQNGFVAGDTKTWGKTKADANGTNFWTDDVYFNVWNSGTYFDKSQNPTSGTIVKYNTVGKKQRSGDVDTVAANKLVGIWAADNSQWDAILGSPHGRYWGVANTSSAGLSVPPRSIDICLAKGNVPEDKNYPFFTLLDNTYKDSTMGTGFMIFRDRSKYELVNGGKTGYTIDTHSSTTMYTDRFINPKITAVYSETENLTQAAIQDGSDGVFHVYVSYYDVFSHCLKYASVDYSGKYTYDNCKFFYSNATAFKNDDVVIAGENQTERVTSYKEEAGEWSDIAIDITGGADKPIPVVVFYNKTARCLQLAVGKNASPKGKTDWYISSLSRPSGSSNFGQYVSMEMDNDGGLYIAAQDVSSAGLCYTYIPKSLYSGVFGTLQVLWQKIDCESNAVWTDIRLANPSGKTETECNPIIVFRNNAEADSTFAVRAAYIENGSWESTADPAVYGISGDKLSVEANVYDITENPVLNKLAVGFNSSMFAVDFLRGE